MKNIESAQSTTISTSASIYDSNGILTESCATVVQIDEPEMGDRDSVIVINGTAHALSDIERDGDTLTSLAAGWTVQL